MIKLNPQYTICTIWNPDKPEARGVFARIFYDIKCIERYPRWYFAPIWPIIKYYTDKHEFAHSWGIKNCLSKSKFCIMHEDNDSWSGKIKLLPYQVINLGRYCPECKQFLQGQKAL